MLFLAFRILDSFRIFPYMDWLVNVLDRATSRLIVFYIAAAPFFVVMIVVMFYMSGANVRETSTIAKTTFMAIRYALGISHSAEFYPIGATNYYVWCILFVFVLYYFLLPISVALFLEAYEDTTMELGHVTDYSHAQEAGAFKRWITTCPPWAALDKKQQATRDAKARHERGLAPEEDSSSDE